MMLEMPEDSIRAALLALGCRLLFVGLLLKTWAVAAIGACDGRALRCSRGCGRGANCASERPPMAEFALSQSRTICRSDPWGATASAGGASGH